jgi:hypothetical protein
VTREDTRHSTWIDIDNDGDLDLYENDMLGPSHLWRNELVETGRPRFEDVTKEFSPPGEKLACPWQSFDSVARTSTTTDGRTSWCFMRWEGGEPLGCPVSAGERDLHEHGGPRVPQYRALHRHASRSSSTRA